MKKILAFAAVLLLPSVAQAQEDHTHTMSAGRVLKLSQGLTTFNEQQCTAASLPYDCTKVQLQAVPGHETDSFYADTLTGRTNFVFQQIIIPHVQTLVNDTRRWDKGKAKLSWDTMSQVEKDAICANFVPALPSGCELY